jgi:NDP-sugar pyrophosphorylase family protein
MKIIVPMAGRGTRMRPHTLTIPKPLVPIAGKAIVHRLMEDIVAVCNEPVEEIAFIIGDFGAEVEKLQKVWVQKVRFIIKTSHLVLLMPCSVPNLP